MKILHNISKCLTVLLANAVLFSCTSGEGAFQDGPGEGIVLNFTTGSSNTVLVKSTPTPGDVTYNETLLNSVYYFLFPKGATSVEPSVSGFKSGISSTTTYTVQIPVSTGTIVNDLFATYDDCQLFAVANPPADIVSALEGKPTLAQLRALTVLSSLKTVPQDNFVMVYDSLLAVTSKSDKVAVNATVNMKHLAAKFTVGAIVIPELTEGGATYTPDALTVSLCNGINRTTLGGWNKSAVQDGDYFDSDYKTLSYIEDVTVETDTYKKFASSEPLYSYPMEWEFNSDTEPYLMYELRWKKVTTGGTEYTPLYYKLSLGRRSIMQNEWYDISGKLTILGSEYPEEPTEIYYYMDYLVAGWNNALEIGSGGGSSVNTPAQIKDTRYLAVAQNEWTLNNKNSVTIPFSSSHPCKVVNNSIRTISYSTGTATNADPSSTTVGYDLSQPNQVTVTHEINNTLGNGMDRAPITIEFDLQHTDVVSFTEHIVITQNPAIMIETIENSGGRSSSNDYGYTYVNNSQSGNWQIVQGANSSGNNSSIYLTVVTVSQFDPSSGFIIGDPRNPEIDNLDINTSTAGVQWNAVNPVSAPAKYNGDSRTIKYYHPTIDDGSRDNYVAPSFRVNSANCRSGQNETYENARQRCASYQEDGYPAGRWRLPTLAECKLVQTMSRTGLIPTVFIQNGTSYYCYAGGWFTGNASSDSDYHPYSSGYPTTTSTGGSGGGAARCVYDEWYWSQVDAVMGWNNSSKTFTWGDVPDDFVVPAP